MDTPTEHNDWRTVLTAQGRSLRWLADQTGKSRRTVYAYSRGDLTPPADWLRRVAQLLGEDLAA